MAKPNPIPNDLNYGHFGQAVYDTETSTWSFGRVPGQRELQHLPTWEANGLPVEQPETAPLDHTCKVRDIRQASKALGRSHPDIVPAIGLLPELAVASTAVTCTASTYDPAVGQLLSFGSITLGKTHQDYPRRVAALPTGEGGGILKVVILSRERHGWVPNRTLWLEESCIHEGESGYWAADAAPILQVCFAQSNSRSAFLAVRSHTKTVLFRPCHYAERKPAVRSRFYELPASRVDPYPVASISFERTGGTPHADVTFNPDYQRQIGIIDQKGNWTIWDIEGGYKGVSKKHTLTCIVTGSMVSQIEADSKELDSREDGWARILWVGDVNTVVVCTRRQLEVYGVKAGKPELLQCPDLIPRHSADWVLDIKRHPKNRHQFCVLTSTRLFLMAVTTQSDDFGTSTVAGAAIALSWVHFRGMDDITLQMSLLGTADRDLFILLSSHLNRLVTMHRIQQPEEDIPRSISSSDPTVLNLETTLFDGVPKSQSIVQLDVQQLHFAESSRPLCSGPGYAYLASEIQFFGVSLMLSNFTIKRAIVYSNPLDAALSAFSVDPISWSSTSQAPIPGHRGGIGTSKVDPDKDFIVTDGSTAVRLRRLAEGYSESRRGPRRDSGHLQGSQRWQAYFAVSFGFLCESLVPNANSSAAGQALEPEDVRFIIERIGNLLSQDLTPDEIPRGTLFDLTDSTLEVFDVDATSVMLHDLCLSDGFDTTTGLQLVSFDGAFAMELGLRQATISTLYDTILQNWIAPLPSRIPGRTRQTKERLARRVAAMVVLANIRLQHPVKSITPGSPKRSQTGFSQDSGVELPNFPNNPGLSDSLEPLFSFLSSSQIPSSYGAAIPSLPSHPAPGTSLSQFLQITKPPPMPPNMSQLLMHLQPNTDPSAYDWDATTRTINEQLHIGDEEQVSQKDKERMKRKAERLLKRKQRERDLEKKAESQPLLFGREAGGLRSSPVPMTMRFKAGADKSSSQAPKMMSSQSQGFGGLGMGVFQSQVEPGRHGGRPKKKMKTRMEGF